MVPSLHWDSSTHTNCRLLIGFPLQTSDKKTRTPLKDTPCFPRKQHVGRRASRLFLPLQEQHSVGVGDVLVRGNMQAPGNRINPPGWSFDLSKIAGRRFIDNHMALAVSPFAAEFFVFEARSK